MLNTTAQSQIIIGGKIKTFASKTFQELYLPKKARKTEATDEQHAHSSPREGGTDPPATGPAQQPLQRQHR